MERRRFTTPQTGRNQFPRAAPRDAGEAAPSKTAQQASWLKAQERQGDAHQPAEAEQEEN
jgi:hypothetical protein